MDYYQKFQQLIDEYNAGAQHGVQVAIRNALDKLPDAYCADLFEQKCQVAYQPVYDSYYGAGRSIYASLVA